MTTVEITRVALTPDDLSKIYEAESPDEFIQRVWDALVPDWAQRAEPLIPSRYQLRADQTGTLLKRAEKMFPTQLSALLMLWLNYGPASGTHQE